MADLTMVSTWIQDAEGNVEITGQTTPNATVKLTVDGVTTQTQSNADGAYTITIPISAGEHTVVADTGDRLVMERVTIVPEVTDGDLKLKGKSKANALAVELTVDGAPIPGESAAGATEKDWSRTVSAALNKTIKAKFGECVVVVKRVNVSPNAATA